MNHDLASLGLDYADQLIGQIKRVKKAMQKAIASNDEAELRVLTSALDKMRVYTLTELPRYFVAGEYFTSYTSATEYWIKVNAARAPNDFVRIVDILHI